MGINRVQFQRGLSIADFLAHYGTEAKCAGAMARARWPDGYSCPKCHAKAHCVFERHGRTYWQCQRCHHQTTAIAGTIFQATKMPLTKWFLAMHLLTQAKNNMSALELMRHLGVCYRTAWTVKHKLLQVMVIKEETRVLTGRVEITGSHVVEPFRQGKKRVKKMPFVVAVQKAEPSRPKIVRLAAIPLTTESVADWAIDAIAPDACITSRQLPAIESANGRSGALSKDSATHGSPATGNGFLGNLKSAISGTYHAFDFEKYGYRYLAEAQYRFNRRTELSNILGGLLDDATNTGPHPEHELRKA